MTAIEGVTQAAGEIADSVEPATAAHLRVVGKTASARDASQALIDQIAR